MSDFWIGFIIGGFICGIIGFLGAAILAASGRASTMEEKIEKDVFRADVPPFKTPEEIVEREKRKIAYLKSRGIIVKQNDPRTD